MSEWINWEGGNCPVPPTTKVVISLRSGQECTGLAGTYSWFHDSHQSSDILAYKKYESVAGENFKGEFLNITELQPKSFAELYPKYYKDISDHSELDVYLTHQLFDIQDPSGCIQHASKKLLLSGCRTGGKEVWKDLKEARDTISRKLQLMGIE